MKKHTLFSRTFITTFLLILSCIVFTGCGFVPATPVRMQLHPQLPSETAVVNVKEKVNRQQLVVAKPVAASAIDTDNIVLVFFGRELRHLSGVRWEDTPVEMLQGSLIESLESTKSFQGVGSETIGIISDVKLFTEIKQFALAYPTEDATPTAEISTTFKLVGMKTGQVVDTLQVTSKAPATGQDAHALVQACEQALDDTLRKVTLWVVATMNKN